MRISSGTLFCLGSGAAFGSMGIFGKLAYDEGADVGTVLAVRFTIGAALLWLLVLAVGREPRRLGRSDLRVGLVLGVFYAAQAGLYFTALTRIDVSILALVLYTYPAIVTVAAIAIGRERVDRRRLGALVVTSTGLVLVLLGAGAGEFKPVGAALGIGAAAVYTTYILISERSAVRIDPTLLSAIVCSGAAVALATGTAATGELHPGEVTAQGWLWLACIGVVSTVAAIGLFFAGLRRVGPSNAAILSTLEPVVTVFLAFMVFSETFAAVQILGAALVLTSVVVLQARSREPATATAS